CSGQSSASPNILVWRANLSQLSALCEGAVWCTCLLLGKEAVGDLGYFLSAKIFLLKHLCFLKVFDKTLWVFASYKFLICKFRTL
ncbi:MULTISPECIES: hypothetical protein, partial [unclassified Gilliamella]|uniref:hypothetical protein n=1 Tax=unclassified Gilliamella TaxID=2685620 RepID=UPI00226A0EA2